MKNTINLVTTLAIGTSLLCSTSVFAQSGNIAREDTVIFDSSRAMKDPSNFNIFRPDEIRDVGLHQAVFEPLFILNYNTGEVEPWLGMSMTSNATLDEWTLTLRDGVKWSDGEAFNADDVVFTINMLLSDDDKSLRDAGSIQSQVASVEKVDDLTVVFKLKAANPTFQSANFAVSYFGSVLMMPEHLWANQDPDTFAFNPPIGTGAYTLSQAASDRLVYDLNEDYWGVSTGFVDMPEPKRLIWTHAGNEEARSQLMVSDKLDIAQSVSYGTFDAIQAMNQNVIGWSEELPGWQDLCPRQIEFNTTVAPWDDPNMREAVNLLIDRNQIVNVAYEGATSVSRTMFVEYGTMTPYINAVLDAGLTLPTSANVPAAQALIEAAGYSKNGDGMYEKDGKLLSADIVAHTNGTESTKTIDIVVEQLRRAGIDAVTRPVEYGAFWQVTPKGDFELSYSWLSCGSVNEPTKSMSRYLSSHIKPIGERIFNNAARWENAAYSDLVSQMGSLSLDDPKLTSLVVDAYKILHEQKPFIPMVQAVKILPTNTTYWTGWPTSENFYNHPSHWWGHTHQIIHNLSKSN